MPFVPKWIHSHTHTHTQHTHGVEHQSRIWDDSIIIVFVEHTTPFKSWWECNVNSTESTASHNRRRRWLRRSLSNWTHVMLMYHQHHRYKWITQQLSSRACIYRNVCVCSIDRTYISFRTNKFSVRERELVFYWNYIRQHRQQHMSMRVGIHSLSVAISSCHQLHCLFARDDAWLMQLNNLHRLWTRRTKERSQCDRISQWKCEQNVSISHSNEYYDSRLNDWTHWYVEYDMRDS